MVVFSFPQKRNIAVLCVDDEPNALLIRRMVLEKAGFHVLTASTVAEAMRMVRTERLDLVLTDYYLKGSTGGALARLIKKAQPQLPVAIYSGAADVPDDVRYADVFLAKAGGSGALIDSLRRLAKPREQAA
jgi:DNA-binding NtrC family response regulator